MIKKLILAAVVAAAGVVALRGTHIGQHLKHEVVAAREWADDQIPVEKKIAQMRRDVAGLTHDVDRVRDDLAREIVEVRDLSAYVATFRDELAGEAKRIADRGARLNDEDKKVSTGRASPLADAKDQLKRDVDLHVKKKGQLASLEKTLASRERIKETLDKQLSGMARQKRELAAEIDAVEAEHKTLQLQQMENRYQRDDSRLSKAKTDLRDLRKKLDIERERLNLAPRGVDEAPPAAGSQSVDDILAPLTGKPAKPENIGKVE